MMWTKCWGGNEIGLEPKEVVPNVKVLKVGIQGGGGGGGSVGGGVFCS